MKMKNKTIETQILKKSNSIYYFSGVHMRLSFDGLAALISAPMKVGDILVADNFDMTRRKIYKVLAGEKHAILYLKTNVREKFYRLADDSGKISIKNLTMISTLLLQLDT
jgi:hypothetical protein